MRAHRLLQLSVWLAGLCLAQRPPRPLQPISEEAGNQVPASELQLLSVGLVQVFQGVHESRGRLERQVERAAEAMEANGRAAERLRGLAARAGQDHRQARRGLRALRTQGEELERASRDLRRELGAAAAQRGDLELRMSRVLERAAGVAGPFSGTGERLDVSLLKVIMDSQSSRLADLATEVMTRDQMIDRNLQHIVDLEEQVSHVGGQRSSPTSPGGTF